MQRIIWLAILLYGVVANVRAEDWPQWLGAQRDAQWKETGTLEKFPEGGPKKLWSVPIGAGYAGPAVAAGRVFVPQYVFDGEFKNDPGTRSKLSGKEGVVALDVKTGKPLWTYDYDCIYEISYPSGPRATPTVDGDRVYHLGAEGHLACLNAKTGKALWKKELKEAYQTTSPVWGFCGHPLVDGDKLFCLVGGKGSVAVAFDKMTGKEIWKALDAADAGYAPPTLIEAGGKKQLLIWHSESLNSLNPKTGEVYWTEPLKPDYGMSIMAPAKSGDVLFVGGQGNIGMAVKLSDKEPKVERLYEGNNKVALYSKTSPPIVDGEYLYGVDLEGQFRCVKVSDGSRVWESFKPTSSSNRRAGSASAFVVKNGDHYLLFNEQGELIIAKLSTAGYEELDRAKLIEPTGEAFGRQVVWTHPAYSNKTIFVRNDKELIAYSLAK